MALYRATKTFVGALKMRRGDVREISDAALVSDLLRAGYIEELETPKKAARATKPKKEEGSNDAE